MVQWVAGASAESSDRQGRTMISSRRRRRGDDCSVGPDQRRPGQRDDPLLQRQGDALNTIMRELIDTRAWPTQAVLHRAVFEYIEGWYNTRRLSNGVNELLRDVARRRSWTSNATVLWGCCARQQLRVSWTSKCLPLRFLGHRARHYVARPQEPLLQPPRPAEVVCLISDGRTRSWLAPSASAPCADCSPRLPYPPLVLLACTTTVAHVASLFTDLLPAQRSPFDVPRTTAPPENHRHSSLDYCSPAEWENIHHNAHRQAA